MARLSDNFYQRKCYLNTNTVPTQSVMINKMTSPLANVYFKSMSYRLKELAGLEPPLKGGGNDWFIPPEEVLGGKVVMKPVANDTLKKLGFTGIASIGEYLVQEHHKRNQKDVKEALRASDATWKKKVELGCRQHFEECSRTEQAANTVKIQQAFQEFTTLYTKSTAYIEDVLLDAAIKEIQAMRDETFRKMKAKYNKLLHDQATMLYDRYTKKLDDEKARQKSEFIQQVETVRTSMGNKIHDVKLEKHIVVEKLRQLQESLNLACQVYVAMKEREACHKEMELSQHEQQKKIKTLKEEIALKNFEIRLAVEKEKKREQLNTIWKKKVCEVVKKFQLLVTYCLHEFPDQCDFFIDIEKLMLLQLSEAIESPKAESIFQDEGPIFRTPIPRPHPFYLFCDKGYKPKNIDQDLCPKHCTSSASQLPVVVVNKRLIYAACDNFEKYTDKITEFLAGRRGEDIDFEDTHIYEHDVPVQVTSSTQLLELKLQSSIMQVLQKELPNARKVPVACCVCNIPYCFCSPDLGHGAYAGHYLETQKLSSPRSVHHTPKLITSRDVELAHDREPKWESYMEYVLPTRCKCGKRAKKHLFEHLPAYMRNTSKYEEPSLPHYEMCPLAVMKRMVKKAQGRVTPPPPAAVVPSKSRDISTQYSDQQFDYLCTCFSDDEMKKLFQQLAKCASTTQPVNFKVIGDDMSSTHLNRRSSSFALECAHTMRKLLDDSPQLQEIFKKEDCKYDVTSLK